MRSASRSRARSYPRCQKQLGRSFARAQSRRHTMNRATMHLHQVTMRPLRVTMPLLLLTMHPLQATMLQHPATTPRSQATVTERLMMWKTLHTCKRSPKTRGTWILVLALLSLSTAQGSRVTQKFSSSSAQQRRKSQQSPPMWQRPVLLSMG